MNRRELEEAREVALAVEKLLGVEAIEPKDAREARGPVADLLEAWREGCWLPECSHARPGDRLTGLLRLPGFVSCVQCSPDRGDDPDRLGLCDACQDELPEVPTALVCTLDEAVIAGVICGRCAELAGGAV